MVGEDVHHGKAQASTSYPQQPENIDMRWINRFNDLRVDDIYYSPPYPPGLRFNPLDEELIKYYLEPKVCGKKLPCNVVIDANLYKYHPKELAEKFKSNIVKDVWYVFTSRSRKYANGGRPDRSAGSGYWKATGSDQEIVDKDAQRIGYKKALVYHEGRQPSKDKTGWMMHEYRIDGSHKPANPEDKTMLLDSWVLCKLYYKPTNHSGDSKDNGAVEKDTSLEGKFEENPTKKYKVNPTEQPEENPTEQPDAQFSEPLAEPQIDLSFVEENPIEQPNAWYFEPLVEPQIDLSFVEENPTEQPNAQYSEPLAEPQIDLSFVEENPTEQPNARYFEPLAEPQIDLSFVEENPTEQPNAQYSDPLAEPQTDLSFVEENPTEQLNAWYFEPLAEPQIDLSFVEENPTEQPNAWYSEPLVEPQMDLSFVNYLFRRR